MIAYKPGQDNKDAQNNQAKRDYFLTALAKLGIEHEKIIDETNADSAVRLDSAENTRFIKLHATLDFLFRYAELMAINMPLREEDDKSLTEKLKLEEESTLRYWYNSFKRTFWRFFQVKDDDSGITADEDHYYTAVYRDDRKQFFNIENEYEFFQDRDRIRMVAYALQGTRYGNGDNEIGIRSRDSWDNLGFLDPVPLRPRPHF